MKILPKLSFGVVFLLVAGYSFLFAQTARTLSSGLIPSSTNSYFIENKGQWPSEVKFLAKIDGMNAWITNNGVLYDFYVIEKGNPLAPFDKGGIKEWDSAVVKGHIVNMTFDNMSFKTSFETKFEQISYYNFFLGNNSAKWVKNVSLYKEVKINNVYPGISIKYYFEYGNFPLLSKKGSGCGLRYDFIVNPSADISQIKMNFYGQDGLAINEKGELVLKTSLGDVLQNNIFAYQEANGIKNQVSCEFRLDENGKINFRAENYDKSLPLIIDPLIFSTYIGGSSTDVISKCAIDANGSVFIAGHSFSANYPSVPGAYQTTLAGNSDCIVSKFNSTGSSLSFSTFIGGTKGDWGRSLSVDGSGNIFVTGETQSSDFPTTSGAYQTAISGTGNIDGFVTKLNSSGTDLLFSTYIGGKDGQSTGLDITVDANGNSFITGTTESSYYPTTSNAYQTTLIGSYDCMVTKLNPTGSALVYSTYLGGNGNNRGQGIKVDGLGNAYVAGFTNASDFPISGSTFQRLIKGNSDCFVSKLNNDGTALIYSTYIGGSGDDYCSRLAIDDAGNAYITGYTSSNDFPVSSSAFQQSRGGGTDCFITKLNSSGSGTIYSTYLGGSGDDAGIDIALDKDANAYVTGSTGSSNFPVTGCPGKSMNIDCFIAEVNSTGSMLEYSTCLGGSDNDAGYGIALSSDGNIFIAGSTGSSDFPTTWGVYQSTNRGNGDCFITKLKFPMNPPAVSSTDTLKFNLICRNQVLDTAMMKNTSDCEVNITNSTITGADAADFSIKSPSFPFNINPGDSTRLIVAFTPSTVGQKNAVINFTGNVSGNIKSILLKSTKDSIKLLFNNIPNDTILIDMGNICPNSLVETSFSVKNSSTLSTQMFIGTFEDPFELEGQNQNSFLLFGINEVKTLTVKFKGSGQLGFHNQTIIFTDYCGKIKYITFRVAVLAPVVDIGKDTALCYGSSITIGDTANSGTPPYAYEWTPSIYLDNPNIAKPTATPESSMQYILKVTDNAGCIGFDTINITVDPKFASVPSKDLHICYNSSTEITKAVQGGTPPFKYFWSPQDGLIYPDSSKPIVNPLTTTKYVVTITDYYGCSLTDSVMVFVNPQINISTGSSLSICPDSVVQLNAVATGGMQPYKSYSWLPQTGLDNPNILNPKLTLSFPGIYKYIITVTDAVDCQASDTIIINVNVAPKPIISGNRQICEGTTSVLKVSNPNQEYNYIWSTGSTDTVTQIDEAGLYWIKVSDKAGCWNTDTIEVNYFPLENPKLKLNRSPELCPGTSLTLSLYDKYSSYQWSDGSTFDSLKINQAGNYFVGVIDTNGCKVYSDTIAVTIVDSLNPKLVIGNNGVICPGGSLTISTKYDYSSYIWSTGETTKTITIDKPGYYSVHVTDEGGCRGTSEMVEVRQSNPTQPIITGDTLLCPGMTDILVCQQNFASYIWSTGETTKQIIISQPGTYSLTVIDTNGCTGSASLKTEQDSNRIVGFKDLVFGQITIGSTDTTNLILTNESNSTIKITNIYTPDNSTAFIIKSIPALPAILAVNQTMNLTIIFIPAEVKLFSDSLIVEISSPCDELLGSAISAEAVKANAKTLTWLPETTGFVGTKDFCIPLFAKQTLPFSQPGNLGYSARIKFDATAFLPEYPSEGYIINGIRYIELSDSNVKFTSDTAKLGEFCGAILLANQDITTLHIDNFQWTLPGVENMTQDGSLSITGICARNLARIQLFDNVRLDIIYNTNSNGATAVISLPEYSNIKLDIYDALGNRTNVIYEGKLEKGFYELSFPQQLPSGLHFAVLKTDTGEIITKGFMIVN